ncbi:GOLPH3/VPS74 family protein [Planctobacterium marinum]|uniref:GPP34 family phosphoprotein n=1 Tax=Planctobacterium marinum TaxID=1631968 RepID=A0AA48HJU1_9ALTE|nr:hypothetical protein MACH26_04180 [Planctobacterium marinum]
MLTLSEKLLLLALHDEKGSVVMSASQALPYGLAGALLLELYLAGRIDISDKSIRLVDSSQTQDALLNEVLVLLTDSNQSQNAKYWLKQIHGKVKGIQARLAEQLVQKKVLAKEERSFLWLINYNRYPTKDVEPEQNIRSHIKDVVLGGSAASEEDLALISLIKASDLTGEVFDKADRKQAKTRIDSLTKEQKVSGAVSQIVEEITAALVVIMAATTVATTVS